MIQWAQAAALFAVAVVGVAFAALIVSNVTLRGEREYVRVNCKERSADISAVVVNPERIRHTLWAACGDPAKP